jgi:hypothetical protein
LENPKEWLLIFYCSELHVALDVILDMQLKERNTMAFAYTYAKGSLKGNYMKKGEKFGLIMWIVVSIPSAFLVFTSMDYPIGFTVNSIVGPLIYMLAVGAVIAKLME